jgi:septal ring factor EnvC (AmiA/AmiB activator)
MVAAVLGLAALGCESNSMDRDLKRNADRATIQLDRMTKERNALEKENEALKKQLADTGKGVSASSAAQKELVDRVASLENQLRASQMKVREMEDAAMSGRQGMPATRPVGP